MIQEDHEFSPKQVAEFLGMRRSHLRVMMKQGIVPFHWVGSECRLKAADVLELQRARECGRVIVGNALRGGVVELTPDELAELNSL